VAVEIADERDPAAEVGGSYDSVRCYGAEIAPGEPVIDAPENVFGVVAEDDDPISEIKEGVDVTGGCTEIAPGSAVISAPEDMAVAVAEERDAVAEVHARLHETGGRLTVIAILTEILLVSRKKRQLFSYPSHSVGFDESSASYTHGARRSRRILSAGRILIAPSTGRD
jgi:hypothetical protein